MRTLLPALTAALILFGAGKAEAAPLAPTGKWVVDFDDAQCVASRAYGAESLFLKASPFGDIVQVGWMRPAPSSTPRQVSAEFRPATGEPFRGNAISWSAGKEPMRLAMINLPLAEFERLSRSQSLAITFGLLERHVAIAGMAQLASVMKSCVEDLQAVWAGQESEGLSARANLASYFTSDDYPADAVRKELDGTTAFALLVDEQGRVADCMVTQTSGQAMLDTQTCAKLKARARFTPATGADGKPRKGRAQGRIRWKLAD